jgi:hypothetical protein
VERKKGTLKDELTDVEKRMLDFESEQFRYISTKHKQIYKKFGLSVIEYYRVINKIIDKRAAMEYSPYVVERLNELRKGYKFYGKQ